MLGEPTGLLGAMKINEKIKVFREIKELTQEEMATQLQLSVNGYANIERGETKLTVDRLEKIAQIFGIDVTELLAFGESKSINFNHSTSTNNFNIIGEASSQLLEVEMTKLHLIISHKDELLEQQKREIETLKMLVDTLKNAK